MFFFSKKKTPAIFWFSRFNYSHFSAAFCILDALMGAGLDPFSQLAGAPDHLFVQRGAAADGLAPFPWAARPVLLL